MRNKDEINNDLRNLKESISILECELFQVKKEEQKKCKHNWYYNCSGGQSSGAVPKMMIIIFALFVGK